jgi:hypothetical protein
VRCLGAIRSPRSTSRSCAGRRRRRFGSSSDRCDAGPARKCAVFVVRRGPAFRLRYQDRALSNTTLNAPSVAVPHGTARPVGLSETAAIREPDRDEIVRPGVLEIGATTMTHFIKKTCVSFVLTFAALNDLHAAFVYWPVLGFGTRQFRIIYSLFCGDCARISNGQGRIRPLVGVDRKACRQPNDDPSLSA